MGTICLCPQLDPAYCTYRGQFYVLIPKTGRSGLHMQVGIFMELLFS